MYIDYKSPDLMELLELILYGITYTLLTLALFLELICYRRKLEYRETILFTISLILLVVSITVSYASGWEGTTQTHVFVLLSMICVGLTTPISIMTERQHTLPARLKPFIMILASVLAVLVFVSLFVEQLAGIEYVVTIFLGLSLTFSMLLLSLTKPEKLVAHRQKIDRYLAVAFLVIIPLSLLGNFVADLQSIRLHTGFTLPAVFIVLAGSKIVDDVQRLGLFRTAPPALSARLEAYALTNRENEVARLLLKGATYKDISEQLFISLPTVKTHASNIYRKCQVKSRAELSHLITS